MAKVAIIDLGTNTFHLLVAETGGSEPYRILHRSHEAAKIGRGGINQGIITDAAFQRAVDAMSKFATAIKEYDVESVHAFATSAIRSAVNGKALAQAIEHQTGIPVQIIPGDREAELIFHGIKTALDLGSTTNLIVDIGAGSVEFIIGNSDGVLWKRSFEIGGQRLLERFMKHDPITAEEIRSLDEYFHETLGPLKEMIKQYNPRVLVGSSGSFDTWSEIYCERNGIVYDHNAPETPLTLEGFYELYHELIVKDRTQRMNIRGMIEMRVDMIVVASCLIRHLLEYHPFDSMRVSTYSLKEGALALIAGSQTTP
jgi:exopolyphosphatase/guanosine-5'-triphosphate,3'-diphosphate pyrophosphatase